jgi:hypothetical protein
MPTGKRVIKHAISVSLSQLLEILCASFETSSPGIHPPNAGQSVARGVSLVEKRAGPSGLLLGR